MTKRHYRTPDGETFVEGKAFQLYTFSHVDADGAEVMDTLKFPRNWLTYATPTDLDRHGLVEFTPEVIPPEPVPPKTAKNFRLTRMQLKMAVHREGFETKVAQALNGLSPSERREAIIRFEHSDKFYADSVFASQLRVFLGMDPVQMEAFWMRAKDIE